MYAIVQPLKKLSLLAGAMALIGASAVQAGNLAFNTIDDFEPPQATGSMPGEFHDGSSGWVGAVTVEASGVDGVPTGPAGGSQLAKVVPGADDSYGDPGLRNAPYAHTGASQAYPPTSADQYSFLVDIYTQAASGVSGNLTWINGVNDSDDTGSGDIVMTEAGFNLTPGSAGWDAIARGTTGSPVALSANAWYTLEVLFDRSGPTVQATHNIYPQGGFGGAPLYSVTSTPDDDRTSGTQGAPSVDMGGPRYSWFTVWDNDTVDAVYIDNIGTLAIPEPASLGLAGLGLIGVAGVARRRRTAA